MKTLSNLFWLISFVSLAYAANFNGDGTYKLYVLDTAYSSNDFSIQLKNVSWHSENNQIAFDSAIYDIRRDGALLDTVTLENGSSATISDEDGWENVTITVVTMGVDAGQTVAALVLKYFAMTRLDSESYVPPPPVIDVNVTSVNVNPGLFNTYVSWTTNTTANGTAYLFNKSSTIPWKIVRKTGFAPAQSHNITGLKSDTEYDLVIEACTEFSCANSSRLRFNTLPVTPVISDVHVEDVTNDSAVIRWETDVPSDASVYYRRTMDAEWIVVPPKLPWAEIRKYFIFNLSEAQDALPLKVASFSAKGSRADLASPSISIPAASSDLVRRDYAIKSDYASGISDIAALGVIIVNSHQIKLYGLEDNMSYFFKASSCADRCANSSTTYFMTGLTILDPYANFTFHPASVAHGSSAVFTINAYSRNPGGHLTNVKVEWDEGSESKSLNPIFGGSFDSFVPFDNENISVISITFVTPGSHQVKLTATDNYSRTSTDEVTIIVGEKTKCSETNVKYYPSDTTCTNKWPNDGQAGIHYNNGIGVCHAFEVCDPNLDYLVADAESCCNGEHIFSSNPTKNQGYDYDKITTCGIAVGWTRSMGAITNLSAYSSMKLCKTNFLVLGIGSQAVYMKDYYRAEACCKDSGNLCKDYSHFQAYNPWPQSNIKFDELWCYYTDWGIFGNTPKDGWYNSDYDPESNNNALADIPAHASVNRMNTGTCVDYSFVTTTALRKAGYSKNQIMSIKAPGHVYNVVWMPGDTKYSFIDTVGNGAGNFFTGPGWTWRAGGEERDHCEYYSDQCSNDGGRKNCPAKSMVWGC